MNHFYNLNLLPCAMYVGFCLAQLFLPRPNNEIVSQFFKNSVFKFGLELIRFRKMQNLGRRKPQRIHILCKFRLIVIPENKFAIVL
jgi:hypothetical protein